MSLQFMRQGGRNEIVSGFRKYFHGQFVDVGTRGFSGGQADAGFRVLLQQITGRAGFCVRYGQCDQDEKNELA